jgi:hypothetical protein
LTDYQTARGPKPRHISLKRKKAAKDKTFNRPIFCSKSY